MRRGGRGRGGWGGAGPAFPSPARPCPGAAGPRARSACAAQRERPRCGAPREGVRGTPEAPFRHSGVVPEPASPVVGYSMFVGVFGWILVLFGGFFLPTSVVLFSPFLAVK